MWGDIYLVISAELVLDVFIENCNISAKQQRNLFNSAPLKLTTDKRRLYFMFLFDAVRNCLTQKRLVSDFVWVSFSSSQAPDSTSGVISKTIDICLHKEGNSFGFVMRGKLLPSSLIMNKQSNYESNLLSN